MRLIDLIPVESRIAARGLALVILAAACAALTWTIQGWRYGQQLELQARLHADTLHELSLASAALQRTEQDNRFALEQRLQAKNETLHKELVDEQTKQARLRDRLATADLRLSVVLAATDVDRCSVSATTTTGCVVHGTTRARLDSAHAQRIIGITNAGDQGLIALRACQAYAKEVSTPK